MTHPTPADAIDMWALLFHGDGDAYNPGHSRQEWAQIADAITAADVALANASHSGDLRAVPLARGDDAWCQIAVDTYTTLHTAGAYQHPRPERAHCHADERAIRAWLDAPWGPIDPPLTVAQGTGMDTEFEPGHVADPTSLIGVVQDAQDTGVFGIDQHRIKLWRHYGDGTLPEHTYKITIRSYGGVVLTSHTFDGGLLLRPGREPVETIVGVLQGVADIANRRLATRHGPSGDTRHASHGENADNHAGVDDRGDADLGSPVRPAMPHVLGVGTGARPFPHPRSPGPAPALPPPDLGGQPGSGNTRHR